LAFGLVERPQKKLCGQTDKNPHLRGDVAKSKPQEDRWNKVFRDRVKRDTGRGFAARSPTVTNRFSRLKGHILGHPSGDATFWENPVERQRLGDDRRIQIHGKKNGVPSFWVANLGFKGGFHWHVK